MKLLVSTAALLAMGVTVAEAKPRPRLIDGEGVVALTGATVIDGTDAAPRPDAMVAIAKDRIAYVGDRAGVRLGKKVKRQRLGSSRPNPPESPRGCGWLRLPGPCYPRAP